MSIEVTRRKLTPDRDVVSVRDCFMLAECDFPRDTKVFSEEDYTKLVAHLTDTLSIQKLAHSKHTVVITLLGAFIVETGK